MVHCCVYNCNNKNTSKSKIPDRKFLRFHSFPKNVSNDILKKWLRATRRRNQDVDTDNMSICSDHFLDADYQESSMLQVRYSYSKGMHILLKPDAAPSTDRDTGLMVVRGGCSSTTPDESNVESKFDLVLN